MLARNGPGMLRSGVTSRTYKAHVNPSTRIVMLVMAMEEDVRLIGRTFDENMLNIAFLSQYHLPAGLKKDSTMNFWQQRRGLALEVAYVGRENK